MTEDERIKAIPKLNDYKMQDETVAVAVRTVLQHHGQPSVGHLARFCPDVFDELFEECAALVENDD